jgi:hypothetical protein
MALDPRWRYVKEKCPSCLGTGKRLDGTRMKAGERGARRGTTIKNCSECMGDGFLTVRKPSL